jgi:Protein of unknown function (DUF4240)
MTMTLRVNLRDINLQFFKDLEEKAGASAQVEIKVESSKHGEGLFSEEQFWQIIELFDWKQQKRDDITQPAITALSKMPVSAIYLFEDFLSEKLFNLDTKEHAKAYMKQQTDGYFSVDDFLYVRCATVAEGKEYYDRVMEDPTKLSADIDFEHLLSVAADAYKCKTGRDFVYSPLYNYETKSNIEKW